MVWLGIIFVCFIIFKSILDTETNENSKEIQIHTSTKIKGTGVFSVALQISLPWYVFQFFSLKKQQKMELKKKKC